MIDADGLHRIGLCKPTYEHAQRTLDIAVKAKAVTLEKRAMAERWIQAEREKHEQAIEIVRLIKNGTATARKNRI